MVRRREYEKKANRPSLFAAGGVEEKMARNFAEVSRLNPSSRTSPEAWKKAKPAAEPKSTQGNSDYIETVIDERGAFQQKGLGPKKSSSVGAVCETCPDSGRKCRGRALGRGGSQPTRQRRIARNDRKKREQRAGKRPGQILHLVGWVEDDYSGEGASSWTKPKAYAQGKAGVALRYREETRGCK